MRYALLALLIFLSLVTFSQKSKQASQVEWKESQKLSWNDFQGKPKVTSSAYAATASIITISFNQINQNISLLEVRSFVDKKKSWVKEKTDNLLKHEQLHADISELYARKIRKALAEKEYRKIEELSDAVNKVYKKFIKEGAMYQHKYDEETNHSIIKEKQKQWEVKIEKELQELRKYSEAEIEIVLKN